jgi:hypothetical protein
MGLMLPPQAIVESKQHLRIADPSVACVNELEFSPKSQNKERAHNMLRRKGGI